MNHIAFSFPSYESAYPGDSTNRYRQYLLDKTKIEYGAGLIANDVRDAVNTQTKALTGSIDAASKRQVEAIGAASAQITSAIEAGAREISQSVKEAQTAICQGLDNVADLLCDLNRRIDMQIEQQRLTNVLLGNIAQLLKIPDSEKERQQAITLGIKFFVNAEDHPDLYKDSLDYLLKAESIQPQDYFVLHRIGYLYLYVESLLDPIKAKEYFWRAAKYAEADSSPDAIRIANLLTNAITAGNSAIASDSNKILLLAADSYEKAAFAAYVANDVEDAIEYQKKALSLDNKPENTYNLSKYLAHKGDTETALNELQHAIESAPKYAVAIFQDDDFLSNPEIIYWIKEKNDSLDLQLQDIIDRTQNPDVAARVNVELKNGSYISKCRILRRAIKLDKTLQA